ncbi:hypothetical protein DFQ01_12076 [Paenibacillus cellulosilyticus]|uniref:Uncharacterized protein n=1 Tax=Paenibacillus cellulosilyticus TaxID=375489 RepID=A0A2V2YP02_9BACL|nr:hypothetical protein [Paenibacillus cellulosilyticus]PWV97889.1 hypothetical protein DFQ01_12076 [Paenibacillus cellulosilyticus]QKS46940.1 hypothetical protein HUB94_20935 [Paenibacillus cellulosilyticus]
MIPFSFEIVNDSTINIEYVYGSEKFILNLFLRHGVWTLHPFDGMLLGNRDLCRSVIADLIRNKEFQIMLAKQGIAMSSLRTTIDLEPSSSEPETRARREPDWEPEPEAGSIDDIREFIEYNTIDDIIDLELTQLDKKIEFYGEILKYVFMQNLGPGDPEFDKIQSLQRTFKETRERIAGHKDFDFGGGNRKRF